MTSKVLILQGFHRYVPTGEFRDVPKVGGAPGETERHEIERKETFPAGKTVEASEEDAADWIAKGLAKAAE